MLYPPFRFPAKPRPERESKSRTVTFHTPASREPPWLLFSSLGVAPPAPAPVAPAAIGSMREEAGYDSERDDPPGDDYHRYWRQRDRGRESDPRVRARHRQDAIAWDLDHPGVFSPTSSFTPDPKVRRKLPLSYEQSGEYCAQITALFACLRMGGYSPEEAIDTLKNNTLLVDAIPALYATCDRLLDTHSHGSTVAATYGHAWNLLSQCPLKHPLRQGSLTPSAKGSFIFPKRLGSHTAPALRERYEGNWNISLKTEKGPFSLVQDPLPLDVAPTLQKSIMRGYDIGRRAGGPCIPLPLIEISVFYEKEGGRSGHAFLVDLSNPRRPGIFDPNLGWIEPPGGFSYLTMEQALVGLVAGYMRYQGTQLGNAFIATYRTMRHINAAQLYLRK